MRSGAILSDDQKHRYSLWRIWFDNLPKVMFIGLNPSRGDAKFNDPTITRCMRFAGLWGFGGMYFLNLYSYRTPYPQELIANLRSAFNTETDKHLIETMQQCEKIVCCWGSWKFIDARAQYVLDLIDKPYCFGVNKNGQPKHPLYLSHKAILKELYTEQLLITCGEEKIQKDAIVTKIKQLELL